MEIARNNSLLFDIFLSEIAFALRRSAADGIFVAVPRGIETLAVENLAFQTVLIGRIYGLNYKFLVLIIIHYILLLLLSLFSGINRGGFDTNVGLYG